MKFVLVIFTYYFGGVGIMPGQYESKEACEAAGRDLPTSGMRTVYACVRAPERVPTHSNP